LLISGHNCPFDPAFVSPKAGVPCRATFIPCKNGRYGFVSYLCRVTSFLCYGL